MSRCRIFSFSSAQILYFSAPKNTLMSTFLLSYFLYFYYQTSPQPPPTNATPLKNHEDNPQKSRHFPSEITWKSCRNHGNF